MSRKDMIIIAVLVNVSVLAVIFITAIGFDDDHFDSEQKSTEIAENLSTPETVEPYARVQEIMPSSSSNKTSGDEVDRVLDLYAAQDSNRNAPTKTIIVPTPSDDFDSLNKNSALITPEADMDEDATEQFVEITVKKGDFLDKIARANGTTADRLIQINHLANDRIDVGQILKVPVSNAKKSSKAVGASTKKAEKKEESSKATNTTSADIQYYTIKSGDNPWKIARQFHVKFEDLLKMNHLNEEKARNLKVGDKIRVK